MGGQAGLATSYCLSEAQRAHLILEQAGRLANAWRHHRWDSFTLVTPNWQLRLPGVAYSGADPDGSIQKRGVTIYPGLYFVGLHWQYKAKSDLLFGVGDDAAFVAEQILTHASER